MVRRYATKGRLKAKHTTVDGLTFDSAFESEVYKRLKKLDYVDVTRQYKVMLKPPSEHFSSTLWACDFFVEFQLSGNENGLLVEAKGLITKDFVDNMALLECFFPEFYPNLLLVFPDTYSTLKNAVSTLNKADKMGLKYCFLSDLQDTVKVRLNLPNF